MLNKTALAYFPSRFQGLFNYWIIISFSSEHTVCGNKYVWVLNGNLINSNRSRFYSMPYFIQLMVLKLTFQGGIYGFQ